MNRKEFLKLCLTGVSVSLMPGRLFASHQELSNVLLIGDSISMGYTPFVQELLKGKANVFRPMLENGEAENCGGTIFGAANIDKWIGNKKWNVIHFNFGLHDLKHVDPVTGQASIKPNDPVQADIRQYTENLTFIVDRLKKTGAKLIFATTTPVPELTKSPLRVPTDVILYNNAALKLMKKEKVMVNDLYTFILPGIKEFQFPNNVHFNQKGYTALAEEVVRKIEKVI